FALTGIGLNFLLIVVIEALQGKTPEGYASLKVVLLLVAGVQCMMLGVVGEYLGRLFLTVNGKPQFVVRTVIRGAADAGKSS
ncbi:hypothetical protein ACI39S_26620, partial [Klebsiella pneumoniae]